MVRYLHTLRARAFCNTLRLYRILQRGVRNITTQSWFFFLRNYIYYYYYYYLHKHTHVIKKNVKELVSNNNNVEKNCNANKIKVS